MLVQITVAAGDLEDVNKLLDTNVIEKPTRDLLFELRQSNFKIVPQPITVLVNYDEWITLSDYEDERQ
jgi:hypothetical protein